MKTLFLTFVILSSALFISCSRNLTGEFIKDPSLAAKLENYKPVYPAVRFFVLSDLHYYDLGLGTNGQDFRDYLDNDRKLLKESSQILDKAVEEISKSQADFVLVSGDLTKDGEMVNHKKVSERLAKLVKSGKKVLVINGNHDILNGQAYSYTGEKQQTVANVNPSDFTNIYWNNGYSTALDKDTNSLSYVNEPAPGLWVLALDACGYLGNIKDKEHIIGGKVQPGTLAWMESVLKRAFMNNKAVIVFMHHGAMEHYDGQKEFYGEYVVDEDEKMSGLLAAYGVRMVFTGHYHAQDITVKKWDVRQDGVTPFLLDIETGSLVTWPCPYRMVNIGVDQTMNITSKTIDTIPSYPNGFGAFAKNYAHNGISGLAYKALLKYGLTPTEGSNISPQVADAFIAHYRGDEDPDKKEVLDTKGLGFWSGIVVSMRRKLVEGLWKDLPPADNELSIDLKTGNAK